MTTALEGGWGVSVTPRPLFTPRKTRYPLYRRLGDPQGRSGPVRKISPPTGIRSPDRPARSQSLYRLRYPAHYKNYKKKLRGLSPRANYTELYQEKIRLRYYPFQFGNPGVTLNTGRHNIQQSYVLPTQCVYESCADLKTNSDYFPIQH